MNTWGPALPGNNAVPAAVPGVVFSRRPIEANDHAAVPLDEQPELQAHAPPPAEPTGTPDEIVLLKPNTERQSVYYRPRPIGLGDIQPVAQAEIWAISRVVYREMYFRGMPTMVLFLNVGRTRRQLAERTRVTFVERRHRMMQRPLTQTLQAAAVALPGTGSFMQFADGWSIVVDDAGDLPETNIVWPFQVTNTTWEGTLVITDPQGVGREMIRHMNLEDAAHLFQLAACRNGDVLAQPE